MVHKPGVKYGETLSAVYKTARGAEKKAEKLLQSGTAETVQIKTVSVYARREDLELSTHTHYKHYGL